MAITAVGSLQSSHPGAVSSGTLSFPAQGAVGNLVLVMVPNNQSPPVHPTSVSGGGITWDSSALVQSSGFAGNWVLTIWRGIKNSTAGGTITVNLSGTDAGEFTIDAMEWTSGNGASSTWTLDKSGTLQTTSGTTVYGVSLTPTYAGELYAGLLEPQNTGSNGSTSGFTYADDVYGGIVVWDLNTGTSALQPTATQSPGGYSWAAAVTIIAGGSAPFIAPHPRVVSQAVKRAAFW